MLSNLSTFFSSSHIGKIHKYITALIYKILQFKYVVAEVTANGIHLGISKKYYHHYLVRYAMDNYNFIEFLSVSTDYNIYNPLDHKLFAHDELNLSTVVSRIHLT